MLGDAVDATVIKLMLAMRVSRTVRLLAVLDVVFVVLWAATLADWANSPTL